MIDVTVIIISCLSLLVIIVISIIIWILHKILKSPFNYPYFKHYFDVSSKKLPDIENLIDEFLVQGNFKKIEKHKKEIEEWKSICEEWIGYCKLKNYRLKQYLATIDDNNAYVFYLVRKQTRYSQSNYKKTSYVVDNITNQYKFDYNYLFNRNEKLKEINYECTLKEYNSSNQRKLMTKELRKQIMLRDNYTCQICGKHMTDEVGLQVDHIVPISKGGKTVLSNLQVLCSKCNGSKSNKQ